MPQPKQFAVIAIPLSRPEIVDFLQPGSTVPQGAVVHIVGQRPTMAAEMAWLHHLRETAVPTVADLLAIDDPHGHMHQTWTDRLVPIQFLRDDPKFLTRNLGGWAPIYFAVIGLPADWPDDPLLNHAVVLADYGDNIRYFGADPALTAGCLPDRKGFSVRDFSHGFVRLHALRSMWQEPAIDYIERLYNEIATENQFATTQHPPIPDTILLDELMGQLVRLEQRRRYADAEEDMETVDRITAWQEKQQAETGLLLILKGEYIMGRHRRSTVLIAPQLGVVVKQPAPEPFHEAELNAKNFNGKPENWPTLTHQGQLVTSRGRLRLIIEEGIVPRLHQVFQHDMYFSTLLGLTIEPFVVGPTVQEWVWADPARMTADLYDVFVLHQQGCELLGVENGDWHAANFVRRKGSGEFVHVDWGAARPLRDDERTPEGRLARLNQVKNIAYSFHDDDLAERVLQLHRDLLADDRRLAQIRQRAQVLIDQHGSDS